MPSLNSRSIDLSNTHVRAGMGAAPVPIQIPRPDPPYLARHPRMISSLPVIFATPDAPLRQFYGRNLPHRRVSLT